MEKTIDKFKVLTKSKVGEASYELSMAMLDDGSLERKFKIIEVETSTQIVSRSLTFKRSNSKDKIKQFVEDSLLNLDDETVKYVVEEINKNMVDKNLVCIQRLLRGNRFTIYIEMCSFVKKYRAKDILEVENKTGEIRIWETVMKSVLGEISDNISVDEMIEFLDDNDLLIYEIGRKKVHINKSDKNPKQGWAYCFKDYKEDKPNNEENRKEDEAA